MAVVCFLAVFSTSNLAGPIPVLAAKTNEESVWHLQQLHRSVGTVDIYVNANVMRLEKSGGDIVILWRQDTGNVSIYNPGHKVIYTCSFDRFYKQGFSVTSGGLKGCRMVKAVKVRERKFLNHLTDVLDIRMVGNVRNRRVEISCADMTVLASKENCARAASVIETTYATPVTGSIPLEMKLYYSPGGGETWFQTNARDLKDRPNQTFFRLETRKVTREKRPASFFAVPANYRKLATDSAVINESDTASDLTRLILPE